ncbi:MAG: serine hydroxymethyltransferase [Aigarchaeota archaeon]|nr:serine hydroxymethyltransferase [Aigarchaeota archaeon]MCX8192326.1 serine hydroxymethyltransferase [Nitrososphaeria archaeon]MDW7986850.1 serine hydroxymethyltransferase [Nitrososphaerota archaeon]
MNKVDYGREAFQKVLNLMEEHHRWFRDSIPLIASENIPSPAVREALISDFGNRYAEGWPGERLYAGCRYIDQVELLAIELGKKVYDAEFVDVRPISGVMANISAYIVFANPGDLMVALAIPHGGHISHGKLKWGGTAGVVRNLDVERYEFDEENFMIDIDGTRKRLEKLMREEGKKPRLFMLGASVFLFPHPVKEVAELAAEYDAKVVYDAAHVAGLIAGKVFQDPLREGADAVTLSTHKTLAGPQHGMILSWNKYSEDFKRVIFPGLHSNHHLHAVAGVAIALAEALAFYEEYARQIVKNAKALAESLHEKGIEVLYEHRGYTESHTLVADVSRFMDGMKAEKKLEEANIILNRNLIPKDYRLKTDYRTPSGIRMGTQEVTRLGMREEEMKEIAEFIKLVLVDGREPREVAARVREFRKQFQHVQYAFSSQTEAYQYIKIR